VHPDLEQAVAFHDAIVEEGGKALVGYELPKALANVVLLSEIPTTYDKKEQRQVNSGNLLIRGVPGVGKTFFGVILAAISDARFARIQGRADLQPAEARCSGGRARYHGGAHPRGLDAQPCGNELPRLFVQAGARNHGLPVSVPLRGSPPITPGWH